MKVRYLEDVFDATRVGQDNGSWSSEDESTGPHERFVFERALEYVVVDSILVAPYFDEVIEDGQTLVAWWKTRSVHVSVPLHRRPHEQQHHQRRRNK